MRRFATLVVAFVTLRGLASASDNGLVSFVFDVEFVPSLRMLVCRAGHDTTDGLGMAIDNTRFSYCLIVASTEHLELFRLLDLRGHYKHCCEKIRGIRPPRLRL